MEKKDDLLVSGLWKEQVNHNMAKLLLANSDAFEKRETGGRIQMYATTEQDTKLTNVYMGPCNELATESGVYPAFTHMQMEECPAYS